MKLSGVQQRTRVIDFVTDEPGEWSEWRDTYEDDMFTFEPCTQVQTRVSPGLVQDAVRKAKAEMRAVMDMQIQRMRDRLYEV